MRNISCARSRTRRSGRLSCLTSLAFTEGRGGCCQSVLQTGDARDVRLQYVRSMDAGALERNIGLDAVRGIAILLVVVSHFLPPSLTGGEHGQIVSEYLGYAGVILFFLLSGFLMEQTTISDPSLISFAVRRLARILPMYWVSVLLAQLIAGPFDLKTIFSNAIFASDVAHTSLMVGVYWMLYVEVRFYAIVPFLRLVGDSFIRTVPFAAIVLNAILFTHFGQASHLVLYLTYCLAGMQISFWRRRKLGLLPLVICVALVSASASVFTAGHHLVGIAPALGCATILFVLSRSPTLPALASVGRVSYSWYLLHSLVGMPVAGFLFSHGLNDWLAAITACCLTLGLSILTFHFIERPAIRVGKLLVDRARQDALLISSK